ncbi:MAG: DUF3147 family protein [Candidatus Sericytochromatia bacterium]
MTYIIFKYFLTASIIVIVSEVAKRSDKIGAIISSLPLVTTITLIWLYIENQPATKIKNHAYYTFWYVIPTLPMFLVFPFLYDKYGFWLSLIISILLTCILFYLFAMLLKKFDIFLI